MVFFKRSLFFHVAFCTLMLFQTCFAEDSIYDGRLERPTKRARTNNSPKASAAEDAMGRWTTDAEAFHREQLLNRSFADHLKQSDDLNKETHRLLQLQQQKSSVDRNATAKRKRQRSDENFVGGQHFSRHPPQRVSSSATAAAAPLRPLRVPAQRSQARRPLQPSPFGPQMQQTPPTQRQPSPGWIAVPGIGRMRPAHAREWRENR